MIFSHRWPWPILFLLALAVNVQAQAPAALTRPLAPLPAKYKVQVRYRTDAIRDVQVQVYKDMLAGLLQLGFELDPPLDELPVTAPEDITRNIITGFMDAARAHQLLKAPNVVSLQLVPADFKLPAMADQPVQVQLELAHNLSDARQRELFEQTRALLQLFDFRETVGYDHRGITGRPNTRLRGTVAAGVLDILIKDLRSQPTGWFGAVIPQPEVPSPLREVSPILVSTVLADPEPVKEVVLPAPAEPLLEKLAPEVRKLLEEKHDLRKEPLRLEIVLRMVPVGPEGQWFRAFSELAPGLLLEGHLGNVLSVVFGKTIADKDGVTAIETGSIEQLRELVKLEAVLAIRLTPAVQRGTLPAKRTVDTAKVLKMSGLERLHAQGFKGKGIHIVVLDSDFRGWLKQKKAGKLPAQTRLFDPSTERNLNIEPDPLDGEADAIGHGTHCALVSALAAPEAELTLVRIEPLVLPMLFEVQPYFRGSITHSRYLPRRYDDVALARDQMRTRWQQLMEERKLVLQNFDDDSLPMERYGLLGAVRGWLFTEREWHRRRLADFEIDDQPLRAREQRLLAYVAKLKELPKPHIFLCPFVWDYGYPLGGRSALTQQLERELHSKLPKLPQKGGPPLWFVPAGDTRGQHWHGWFRDDNDNGILEHATAAEPLPKGSWTPELNFLSFAKLDGATEPLLPKDTRLRFTLQWTERHAPEQFAKLTEPDPYARPLNEMTIALLRQRDPTGKSLSQDDFVVVARSRGVPLRLENTRKAVTYELTLDYTVEQEGNYALHIDKQRPNAWLVTRADKGDALGFRKLTELAPQTIQPLGVRSYLNIDLQGELWPRLFVRRLDSAAPAGRVLLRDYRTDVGSLGAGADGHEMITVGATDLEGRAQPYSVVGPPMGQLLRAAPRLFTFDQVGPDTGPAHGTSVAAAFAAGMTAAWLSGGLDACGLEMWLRPQRPQLLVVP